MKARLITSFKDKNEGAFLAIIEAIKAALTSTEGIALFPDPWGDPTKDPTRTQLAAAITAHGPLYTKALKGGHDDIIARNDSRATITGMLQAIAPILEDIVDYDAESLAKSGFELRKEPSAPITGTLPGPQDLKLANGNASGVIKVSVKKLAGAKSYEVWICSGNPDVETNWHQAITVGNCRGIEVSGLVPVTKCYVRVRGIGSKGPGGWSNIESIVVN